LPATKVVLASPIKSKRVAVVEAMLDRCRLVVIC